MENTDEWREADSRIGLASAGWLVLWIVVLLQLEMGQYRAVTKSRVVKNVDSESSSWFGH